MHIPMEFLSLPVTRTDSGKGVQQQPRSGPKDSGVRFDKKFEEQLNRHDQKMLKKQKVPDVNAENPDTVQKADTGVIKKDTGPNENLSAVLTAGAISLKGDLGIQEQESVFILEGEESVNPAQRDTIPEQRVKSTDDNPQQVIQSTAEAEKEETAVKTDNTQVTQAAKPDPMQGAKHAENSETAAAREAITAKSESAAQISKEDAAGELTARTPEVTPDSSTTDKQPGNNLNNNGNPGPLENENEKAQVTGHEEEKAFDRAVETVKTKKSESSDNKSEAPKAKPAETAAQTVNTTPMPPLSEGIKAEQFKGAQQMTQAAHTPVKPENLFQEMISRVETMQTAEKSTMTIQLNPEYLGKVALEVAIDAQGLHVKINAEDSSVRGMINSQLATLIESLENKGIAVSEVEVVFAGANFDHFSQQGDGREHSSARDTSGRHVNKAKDTIEYYNTISNVMDFYMDSGRSSVEYVA